MDGNRRKFLGSVAALSATGAFLPSALGAETPGPEPVSADWDVSWRNRIVGSFRAVFDNPIVNEGVGLWRAGDWKRNVMEVYGDEAKDASTVLVIRHEAIPMIMNHAFWERHEIGVEHKLNDRNGSPVKYNPYLAREGAAGEAGGGRRGGGTIDSFLESGGIVLACNYAFGRSVVGKEARKAGIDQAAAREVVLKQVIPGVIIQPSGFFAVIEAQRSGCHFFPAAG
jgi:hypothetical protein